MELFLIILLCSLVMHKYRNLFELLSSNKNNKRTDQFQIKTKMYSHLPHLQSTKTIMQILMKFTHTRAGSFATAFSYIFEKNYVSIRDEGYKMVNTNKYNISCPTCKKYITKIFILNIT